MSNGSVAEVGPLIPPATVAAWTPTSAEEREKPLPQYVGASPDLSHIWFSDEFEGTKTLDWLWPGDKTVGGVRPSLYEYVGSGNTEPELVGVRNDEGLAAAAASQHKAHINEAAEQISECGVVLGGAAQLSNANSADTYNAISRSGEVIYFTPLPGPCETADETGSGPAVTEVYGRIERRRTVDISEPTTGATGDCETCDESEPRSAVFQGASEDGTRAFFISSQKLFGGADGEEGTNLYEFDLSGPAHHELTFIAPNLAEAGGASGGVMRVSESGDYVYFVSTSATVASSPFDASGGRAQPEAPNLYVRDTDTGATTFVGTLSAADELEWSVEDSRLVDATQDGRFLVFPSVAHLTQDARGVGRQLYRYEVPSAADPLGQVIRISIGATGTYFCPETQAMEPGFNCDGNAGAAPPTAFSSRYERNSEPQDELEALGQPRGTDLASDGSQIFFESPEALVPGALDRACAREEAGQCAVPANNVYEWSEGDIFLLSDGLDSNRLFGASATKLIGADPSGTDVFITTSSALVPEDVDSQVDVYDVRAKGGFPPEALSTPCSASCRATEPSRALPSPASIFVAGAGNTQASAAPTPRKSTPKPLTRAQKLRKALKVCRTHRTKRRAGCERAARVRFGTRRKASKGARRARRVAGHA